MQRTEKFALSEFLLEEKEEKYIGQIKVAFDVGDIEGLIKSRDNAENLIRRREKRITYKFIRAAKRAKINVYGKPIDIFEKELLEKHQQLYELLGRIDYDTPELIEQALELEKSILQYVEVLVNELNKPKVAAA